MKPWAHGLLHSSIEEFTIAPVSLGDGTSGPTIGKLHYVSRSVAQPMLYDPRWNRRCFFCFQSLVLQPLSPSLPWNSSGASVASVESKL